MKSLLLWKSYSFRNSFWSKHFQLVKQMISVAEKGKASICCEAAVSRTLKEQNWEPEQCCRCLKAACSLSISDCDTATFREPGSAGSRRVRKHNAGLYKKCVSSALLPPVQHSFHFIVTGSGRVGGTCDRAAQPPWYAAGLPSSQTEEQVCAATCCSLFWSSSKRLDAREALQWSRETCRFLPSCNTPLVKTGQRVRQLCV